MKVDFLNYKFHCSSLGLIMTDARAGKNELGETCKQHLTDCYVSEKYGRDKEIVNKYVEKGTAVEEDSITLYSRVTKTMLRKNEDTLTNDYLTGTPDIILETGVKDIKSSWDLFTFYANLGKAINKKYWWQLQGYMALTGKESAGLVYCLVNTPEKFISDAKRQLSWKMGLIDPDVDENYIAGCEAIEKEMLFDDIPIEERYIEFVIKRDDSAIGKAYQRVHECREFLNKLP